jgi:hypothetical protein
VVRLLLLPFLQWGRGSGPTVWVSDGAGFTVTVPAGSGEGGGPAGIAWIGARTSGFKVGLSGDRISPGIEGAPGTGSQLGGESGATHGRRSIIRAKAMFELVQNSSTKIRKTLDMSFMHNSSSSAFHLNV